jgi:hypothetical protein
LHNTKLWGKTKFHHTAKPTILILRTHFFNIFTIVSSKNKSKTACQRWQNEGTTTTKKTSAVVVVFISNYAKIKLSPSSQQSRSRIRLSLIISSLAIPCSQEFVALPKLRSG